MSNHKRSVLQTRRRELFRRPSPASKQLFHEPNHRPKLNDWRPLFNGAQENS
jgi:hypothetical protein